MILPAGRTKESVASPTYLHVVRGHCQFAFAAFTLECVEVRRVALDFLQDLPLVHRPPIWLHPRCFRPYCGVPLPVLLEEFPISSLLLPALGLLLDP